MTKFAILGAGNGAISMAADLTLRGYSVNGFGT
jgi:3-hydroxyisobutyrate dehydrogenase-like beta-hydroxyacid dehydrogenase